MSLVQEWGMLYESTKKQLQVKRSSGTIISKQEAAEIMNAIGQLTNMLKTLNGSPREYEISPSELARRQVQLDNLKKSVSSSPSAGKPMPVSTSVGASSADSRDGPSYNPLATSDQALVMRQKEVIKHQDDMLEELGKGVGVLHVQALRIGEEVNLQNKILDSMETDVEMATAALQAEARHAEKIRDSTRMCYLYVCVAVEVIVIVLLLILMVAG